MDKNGIYFSLADEKSYFSSGRHIHEAIEIYYLTGGICHYFIDGEPYTLAAGYTVIVPSGVIHRTNYGSATHSRYLLNIPREYIPSEVISSAFALGYLFDTRADGVPKRLFDKIAEEYERGDELSPRLIGCYATELLAHLARSKCSVESVGEKNAANRAVKYVKEGYSGEISLTSLAARLGITPEHLSRSFKAQTGFGFNEYLTLLRLRHAEIMLHNEPGRSVGEIAYAVGFNDSNYFSKRFKEIYGTSPTAVRKKKK